MRERHANDVSYAAAYAQQRQIRITAQECVRAFREKLKNEAFNKSAEFSVLRDEYARFRIWCSNAGVREHGRASLDSRLQHTDDIRILVMDMIEQVTEQVDKSEPCYVPSE